MDYKTLLENTTKAQKLINERRPFDKSQFPQLMKFYKVENTWASNAVEGNSITLSETQMILENGVTVHGHTIKEIEECVGHGEAFDYMSSLVDGNSISEENVKKLHYLFARNIKDIPCPGEYRDVSKTYVYITGSDYPCPDYDEVPEKMRELSEWLDTMKNEFHPVELAAEYHRKFVYIHPFPDGNGRIARLLMNTILLQNRYMPISIKPAVRKTYIKKLEEGHVSPLGFDTFIAERELKEQVRFMKLLHIEVPQELEPKKSRDCDRDR